MKVDIARNRTVESCSWTLTFIKRNLVSCIFILSFLSRSSYLFVVYFDNSPQRPFYFFFQRNVKQATPSAPDSHDMKEGRFLCACCDIDHQSAQGLLRHFQSVTKKYQCSVCSLEFCMKSDLIDHMRVDHQVC